MYNELIIDFQIIKNKGPLAVLAAIWTFKEVWRDVPSVYFRNPHGISTFIWHSNTMLNGTDCCEWQIYYLRNKSPTLTTSPAPTVRSKSPDLMCSFT